MNHQLIITNTTEFVKERLKNDATGHDWWHIHRVVNIAANLAHSEGADAFVVKLAALLHDVADWKFFEGTHAEAIAVPRNWLNSLGVEKEVTDHVCEIIENISFKGAGVATPMRTIEGKVVQDADRLDAIGAVGIARAFAYGGSKGREMFNPAVLPEMHQSFNDYKKNQGTTINHFHEKLLLLKDRMNTKNGRILALKRHEYMLGFLQQFESEWEGTN